MSLDHKAEMELLVVIFSFNRAMQLDNVLHNMFAHLKVKTSHVTVVYHTTGAHAQGYIKLRAKYEQNGLVSFYERQPINSFVKQVLPLLIRPRNLYRYLKYNQLRNKLDNFKWLVESLIEQAGCEFVMFSTDDTIFFRDAYIPVEMVKILEKDPFQSSYRMYVGRNHANAPQTLEKIGDLLKWDYFDKEMYSHWAYPFAVDGTVYCASALLQVIQPVLYHNPTTLEAFICKEFMLRRVFRYGYSPIYSTMVGVPLNKVQTMNKNFSGSIDVEMLNSKWLEGYSLEFELPDPVDQNALAPKRAIISKGSESIDLLCALSDENLANR